MKYSSTGIDNIRQRFNGYEKDIETDLDFAEARMYKNRHGRFTSPDPLLASASLDNPQTFNRYVYVGNNPVNLIDPSGLSWCRDKNRNITNSGNAACPSGTDIVDGQTAEVAGLGPLFKAAGANVGDVIRYNSNNTITVLDPSNQQDAASIDNHYGTIIQAESNPVEVSQDIALGTAIAPRSTDLLPLPCQEDNLVFLHCHRYRLHLLRV